MYILLSEYIDISNNIHIIVQIRESNFRLVTSFSSKILEQKLKELNLLFYKDKIDSIIKDGIIGKLYKI